MKNSFILFIFFIAGVIFQLKSQTTVTIGTGTTTTDQPFNTYWHDSRTNWIILASELTAQGAAAGNITEIGFNVSSRSTQQMNGFNIRMQHTASTTMSSFVGTGWTTVYSQPYTVPGTGWQMITLTTPFNWNGTSNLLIEICFDNTSYTSQSPVFATSQTNSVWSRAADNQTGCTMTGGTVASNRPNTRLAMAGTPPPPGCLNTINSWSSNTAPSAGNSATISMAAGRYGSYSSCVAGVTYSFTSSISTDYITIRQNSFDGPIVAAGTLPLSFPCSANGTYFVHVNTNSSCGENTTSRTITMTRPCDPPTTQANAPTFTSIGNNQLTVNWSGGTGNGTMVVARLASTTAVMPTNGQTYTANTTFGNGGTTGTGNFVVFRSTSGSSVIVYGLTAGTSYAFDVYKFNSTGNCYKTPAATAIISTTGGCTPPTTQANTPTFTSLTNTGVTVNWSGGTGDGTMVVGRLAATTSVPPTNGQTYTASTTFGSGNITGTGNFVVFRNTTGSSVSVTGLTAGTAYAFDVYKYNNTGICYRTPAATATITTTGGGGGATCLHSIDLTDTYGDGWNGGAITVTVNGTPVLTNITLASGFGPGTHTFDAGTGDIINVTRTLAGSYPSEMRIRIYSDAGEIISLMQPVASPGTNGNGNCASGGSPTFNKSSTSSSAWNAGTTWSTTACGAGGTTWPTLSTDNVLINCASRTVTTSGTMTCGDLTISAGTLTLSSGTLTVNGNLTLSGGTLTINGGTLQLMGGFTYTSGTFTNTSGSGEVIFMGSSAQAIPALSFFNLRLSGTGAKSISGTTTVTNILTTVSSVGLTINSGGTLTLSGSSSHSISSTSTITIASGGTFNVSGAGNLTASGATYSVNGLMNFSRAGVQTLPTKITVNASGELRLSGSSTKTFSSNTTINGKLSIQGTATSSSSWSLTYGAGSTLEYKGSSSQTINTLEWPTTGPTNVIIDNTSGVSMPSSTSRSIPGTLTLVNGAFTHSTSATLTFNGTASQPIARTNGTLTMPTTASLSFSPSSVPQHWVIPNNTFTSAPTFSNLTVAMGTTPGSLTLNNQEINVTGTTTLTSGLLILGTGDLQVTSTSISSPGTTRMIVTSATSGFLKRSFSTSSFQSFTFPIGENVGTAEYSGFSFSLNSNSVTRVIGFKVVDGIHPSMGSATHYLSRYWVSSVSNSSGNYEYSMNLPYNGSTGDIVGTESKIGSSYWDASSWKGNNGSINTSSKWISLSSVNQTNSPLGFVFAGRAIDNDDPCDAIILTPGAAGAGCTNPVNASSAGATQTYTACSGTANDDVWFRFTATATSHSVIVTPSASFNPVLQGYTLSSGSCPTATFTAIGSTCTTSGAGTEATMTLSGLTIGTVYYVRVHHSASSLSADPTFSICVLTPPANDEPCSGSSVTAITLTPNHTCVTTPGNAELATQTFGYGSCDFSYASPARDVWFRFQATNSSHTVLVTGNGTYNPVITAYTGGATCPVSLTAVSGACVNTTGAGATETLTLTTTIGTWYYVRVYHAGSAIPSNTTFTICVLRPPDNDEPCIGSTVSAVTLTPGLTCVTTAGDANLASQTFGYGSCDFNYTSTARDVWYRFQATNTSHTVLVTGNSTYNPVITAYTGGATCPVSLTAVSGACVNSTGAGATESLTLTTTIGTWYYVRVYHTGSGIPSNTTFTICVLRPPDNNDPCGAIPLSISTTCNPTVGSNLGAVQSFTFCGGSTSPVSDVWYSFTATGATHFVTVTGSSSFAPATAVYWHTSGCGSITSNTSMLSGSCTYSSVNGSTVSMVLTGLTAGRTYYVRVYHYNGGIPADPSFTICVTSPAPPTYCSIPYTQSFENTWGNGNGLRDIPESCWANSPGTGDNSWRRNDDGVSAGWGSASSGSYSPASSEGTYSARFHSYNTSSTGNLDLYLNLSTSSSSKKLTFDYINTSGTDNLKIMLSTDGGNTFPTTLGTITTASSWTTYSYVINSNSATAVIRFHATGQTFSGDIGLDNISVNIISFASIPYTQDFEGPWVNNDGTRDVPTNTPTWANTPPSGNNSWRRNDDGASAGWGSASLGIYSPVSSGGAHSARFHTYNVLNGTKGALDVYLNLSPAGTKNITFDHINTSGSDVLKIFLSTDAGITFTQLGSNITSTSGGWNTVTFQTTATSATSVLRFEATSDYGTTDIGIDNLIVYQPIYGSLPYAVNFDATWTTRFGTQDIPASPSSTIINTPGTGDYSWRRHDAGSTAGWGSASLGIYSPVSSQGTGSARFHSYNASAGMKGNLDFYVNLSAAGNKILTFDYINTSGNDVLNTFLSTDGGVTFSQIGTTLTTASTWTTNFVIIGTTSATAVLRFEATSDYGSTDIGLDNINISVFNPIYATLPYNEHFDGTWVNKYNTRDVPSNSPTWINTPVAGNASWRRNDDGAAASWTSATFGAYSPTGSEGTPNSARFHSYSAGNGSQGSLDLYINLSPTGTKLISFDYINTSGSDILQVLLSTDGGATFTQIGQDFRTASTWASCGITTTTTSATCVIRFLATSDAGMTDIGLDNVSVSVVTNTYATLPYQQDFEDNWVGRNGMKDIPVSSSTVINTPAHGNNSWRRNDDGASGNWTNVSSGGYFPVYSSGEKSARFHTYDAASGLTGDLDFYVNLSPVGTKHIMFDYINTSGTDRVQVFLSTDGGGTFTQLGSNFTTSSSWSSKFVTTTSTAANAVVRFRAISDFGSTDIGIDNIYIGLAPENDEPCGAILLTQQSTCNPTNGNTILSTQTMAKASCDYYNQPIQDVWFQFVATGTSANVIVNSPGNFNALVQAFTATGNCPSLVLTAIPGACVNNFYSFETLHLTGLTIGVTYYVRVYHADFYSTTNTTFTICVVTPPVNDDCPGSTLPWCSTVSGTTVNSSGVDYLYGEYGGDYNFSSNWPTYYDDDDVWYTFNAQSTEALITLTCTGIDGILNLRRAISCPSSNIQYRDFYSTGGNETMRVSGLTVGTNYRLRVFSYGIGLARQGAFSIRVCNDYTSTLNDNAANAITASIGTNVGNSNTNFGFEIGEPSGTNWNFDVDYSPTVPSNTQWFVFTPTNTGSYNFNTAMSGGVQVAIYSASSASQILSGSAQQVFSGSTSSSTLNFNSVCLTSAQTYYIQINGYLGSTGTPTLTITFNGPDPIIVSGEGTFYESATLTASGGSGGTIYWQGTTSGGTSTDTPSTSETVYTSGTYYFRPMSNGCWGDEASVTVTVNPSPYPCTSYLLPQNGISAVALDQQLEWNAASGATAYNVYFDTLNPPVAYAGLTTNTYFNPYIPEYNKTYYWQVIPLYGDNEALGCQIWSFTSEGVHCADITAPAHLSENITLTQILYWTALPGVVSYDVYFGTSNPPALVAVDVFENFYNPTISSYNTQYFWKVIPKAPNSSVADCNVNSFTTMEQPTNAQLTWKVSPINNEWDNANNWWLIVGSVTALQPPTYENDVIIPSGANIYPMIDNSKLVPAECKDMLVQTGASIIINPNKGLTINGNMINNGTVFVHSAGVTGASVHDSHDGSLIIKGTVGGSGTYRIDRYISGNFWHMVSPPVSSASANVFTNMWIRTYNEHNNTWGSFITSPTTPLLPGAGYAVWTYENSVVRTFNGTVNHGNITLPVQYTDNPNLSPFQKGWNLVGNPYPSAINWNQGGGAWSKTAIAGTIYLYSAKTGNYLTWNGFAGAAGPIIAMGQGFFVQTANANAQLIVTNAARLHSEAQFRSAKELDDIIAIKVEGNNYSDECYLMYRADASEGYDFQYDAYKMPGLPAAPQLYTKKTDSGSEINLAVYSTGNIENLQGKLVYLEVGNATQYTLSFEHGMVQDFSPVIRDRFVNVIIQPEQEYLFTATPSDNSDRFEILDVQTVSSPIFNKEELLVWTFNNILYIDNINENNIKQIVIYNMLGAEVLHSNASVTDVSRLPAGVYNVRVMTEKQTIIKKIVVH